MPQKPHRRSLASSHRVVQADALCTLAVDIGGSNIKASVLDGAGKPVAGRLRRPTPRPAPPDLVLSIVAALAEELPAFDRVSVGFPGVVRAGTIVTAPNLGTEFWAGFPLIETLAERFGVPVRVLNDAAVQGLGVVHGPGLECVLTLGTGVGCALFRDRGLLLHLEFGQHGSPAGGTYDQYIGQAALAATGDKGWNERVRTTIDIITSLTCCEVLYIGGGNARKIGFALPPHVRVVSNAAGITGGIRLWEDALDALFSDEPMAHMSSREVKR